MADETDREKLARGRTDLAEDRTVLANERTYASWMRTGLACIGVGLGFRALMRAFDPAWVAQSVATVFIAAGIAVIWLAWRRAAKVLDRLENHTVDTMPLAQSGWLAAAMIGGGLALGVVLWLLE